MVIKYLTCGNYCILKIETKMWIELDSCGHMNLNKEITGFMTLKILQWCTKTASTCVAIWILLSTVCHFVCEFGVWSSEWQEIVEQLSSVNTEHQDTQAMFRFESAYISLCFGLPSTLRLRICQWKRRFLKTCSNMLTPFLRCSVACENGGFRKHWRNCSHVTHSCVHFGQ